MAWAGAASRGHHLEVPGALAGCLNIAQGITVTARAVSDIPEAVGVCVEPISVDDWEVVEQNAGHMEEQILSQVSTTLTSQSWGSQCRTLTSPSPVSVLDHLLLSCSLACSGVSAYLKMQRCIS